MSVSPLETPGPESPQKTPKLKPKEVCFQHTILLVDWLGGSGYAGIESFQPITSQVSKVSFGL